MTKIYISIMLFLSTLSAIAYSTTNKATPPQCPLNQPHTTLNFSHYRAHIIEPDNEEKPEAWQGPLCLENKKTGEMCVQELSIIWEVKEGKSSSDFLVKIYSGSTADKVYLDGNECNIIKIEPIAFE